MTGRSLCRWISSAVIRTGPVRSARRVVVRSTVSAARWEDATASGSPSSSHSVKPTRSPVASHSTDTVIRWAPAPIRVATADSRITVGNSSASITTSRVRSARALARARNTGRASAARPEVAGTANAVTTSAAVVRCVSCRTVRAPPTRKAAARPASPVRATAAASTNAQISSHTVESPRVPKRVSLLITPVTVSASPAPSAMYVSSIGVPIQAQVASANTARVRRASPLRPGKAPGTASRAHSDRATHRAAVSRGVNVTSSTIHPGREPSMSRR